MLFLFIQTHIWQLFSNLSSELGKGKDGTIDEDEKLLIKYSDEIFCWQEIGLSLKNIPNLQAIFSFEEILFCEGSMDTSNGSGLIDWNVSLKQVGYKEEGKYRVEQAYS